MLVTMLALDEIFDLYRQFGNRLLVPLIDRNKATIILKKKNHDFPIRVCKERK